MADELEWAWAEWGAVDALRFGKRGYPCARSEDADAFTV
jgi:hypothetical protein